MTLNDFLAQLKAQPETITFELCQQTIADNYTYTASAFNNNGLQSSAEQNQGSCKILAFARLNNLSKEQTLHCFGDYYRIDVVQHPENDDHGNIRTLLKAESSVAAVTFDGTPLQ
ncbi:type III effector [Pseudoalteromonas phenolica]|uniref:Type III effector n=1 Tax=Pseudoalteromonas phenolica TaxID=161398 RepID=A0A5R9PX88_9GAMM|nr:HopJ type III effector protein [Pseudoalteromonas phenolica]TLX45234.1 type III effector [Pseudoalteromonas phenolica]